jgi:hypothetical protein
VKKHSLIAQITEVEREIRQRRQDYPKRVARHEMRQGEADHLISLMEGVRETLRWIQRNEDVIRGTVPTRRES